MGSELAVIERLNQLQLSLDKVERTLAAILIATVQAKQATDSAYLDLADTARYLHTPEATIRKWVRTKGLPYYKPGKTLCFRPQELDAWMRRYRHGLHGLALTGFNERMQR